jgi:ribosomal protein S18 acetylase RimI-like enzyme
MVVIMIQKVSLKDILDSPNSESLFYNYFKAGSEGLLPNHNVCKPVFYAMEKAGLVDCFGLYSNKVLVGFIIATTTVMPHYSVLGTTVMSIYIEKEHRGYGKAKQLLLSVEHEAIKRNSSAVIISSPVSSKFGRFSTTLGYKKINELFGKALKWN